MRVTCDSPYTAVSVAHRLFHDDTLLGAVLKRAAASPPAVDCVTIDRDKRP